MSSEQRNAEIWSTRLQRELLALTEGGAEDPEHVAAVLPPFITLINHEIDIPNGICTVSFHIKLREEEEEEKEKIVVLLNASLHHKQDGSVNAAVPAYPFEKPTAILQSGSSCFPEGSTVRNGDLVDIDCDWTPSLHLSDAVLNVGLKVKESILQQEPFYAAEPEPPADPVEELAKGAAQSARRLGNFITMSANKGAAIMSSSSSQPKKKASPPKKKIATPDNINIGDEINLLEAPWVDCHGVYSCKAIRRPAFVEDAIAVAAAARPPAEAAGAGFAGAGAMFRSFKNKANSVLEESFLMITDTHLIELRSSKLNLSSGVVTIAIAIDMTAKLKFRRQESISLFFKPAPDDPLIYMCPDSADAVHQIQFVLQQQGVRGKHTNAAAQRAVNEALQIVQEIQAKERALEYKPSVERVNEIMDLYRQAAERFELAGDQRHEEVVTHMRKFLDMPLVVSLLDGSFVPAEEGSSPRKSGDAVPEGEVLERTKEQLEDDDMSVDHSANEDNGDKAFSENMDNLMKEAKEDFGNLQMADSEELNAILKDENEGEGDDAIADLDAMLTAADKEIDDIMNL
jgi:hypothetical protein